MKKTLLTTALAAALSFSGLAAAAEKLDVRVNQAIQFPDREEWDENKKCVCFPALVNGMQLTCAISGESLAYRFTGDTPEQWLASFRQHRWDLEEEAENLIQEQNEDDQGWVWLP